MKKKENKTINPVPKNDSQQKTRVLIEKISSDLKTVAEQYGGISDKLKTINEMLQKHESVRLKLEWGIEAIKNRLGTVDTKVDRIESELETVKLVVKDIDGRLEEKAAEYENRLKKIEVTR